MLAKPEYKLLTYIRNNRDCSKLDLLQWFGKKINVMSTYLDQLIQDGAIAVHGNISDDLAVQRLRITGYGLRQVEDYKRKNRDVWLGFLLGVLSGIISTLLVQCTPALLSWLENLR